MVERGSMLVKQKKCRHCGNKFSPFSSTQTACGLECAKALAPAITKKRIRKKASQYRKDNKSLPTLIKEAQKVVNEYVRLRDAKLPCISCEGVSGKMDAGHYRSVGSANHLRFNLHNINKQDYHCNCELSGNVTNYRIGLIKKIGIEKVEALENNNEVNKYTKEYLIRLRHIFTKKIKMRKMRESSI